MSTIIVIPIAAILWLIAAFLLAHVLIRYVAVAKTFMSEFKKEEVNRYFLWDAQDKKWVESEKNPTGGK